jgi:hypothetical protein
VCNLQVQQVALPESDTELTLMMKKPKKGMVVAVRRRRWYIVLLLPHVASC